VFDYYVKKGSPYSITERRVPVLGSQPGGRLPFFPPGPQLPPQPLRGLLPFLLLSEQMHNGCEQFAEDCYPTASRLLFEPGHFSA